MFLNSNNLVFHAIPMTGCDQRYFIILYCFYSLSFHFYILKLFLPRYEMHRTETRIIVAFFFMFIGFESMCIMTLHMTISNLFTFN